MAGLIEGAHGSANLRAHLLRRLPEVYDMISGWTFTAYLHPDYTTHLENGYTLLMVSVGDCLNVMFCTFACSHTFALFN